MSLLILFQGASGAAVVVAPVGFGSILLVREDVLLRDESPLRVRERVGQTDEEVKRVHERVRLLP